MNEKVRKGIVPKGYKFEHTTGTWWIEYELDDWLHDTTNSPISQ